jgi:DNA processing protein
MLKNEFWLALASVEDIGPKRFKLLLDRFNSVERVLQADIADIVSLPKFNPLLAKRILEAGKDVNKFKQQLNFLKENEVDLICLDDADYPKLLKKTSAPPPVLCKKGVMDFFTDQAVAIVGTRNPTDKGILATIEIATEFASAGFTVVSGLAKGIDTAAHFGALEANGRTIGVLGCSLWRVYPRENQPLASRICENGMLLSEHPFPAKPTSANLVSRNRIISGLSSCVIVIETEVNGGAIRTAQFAEKQGRKCYVYNWQKEHSMSSGSQWLINKFADSICRSQIPGLIDRLKEQELDDSLEKDQMELFKSLNSK